MILKYNLRSLFVRKSTTAMTVLSIAFVVLVFVGVYSLAVGLERAFGASGDPANVMVMRDGARSETESYSSLETFRQIAALPGVERDAEGKPLASGEVLVLQIFEREDGSESNVTVRGVMSAARSVRPTFEIAEGRDFTPGKGEIIVGKNIAGRFPSLSLGETVRFGRLDFRVVGVFAAGGGGSESEVWGALEDIGNAFRRENNVSSIRLRTGSEASAAALIEQISSDQRFQVNVLPEQQYYAAQTDANTRVFKVLGTVLAVLMGFGACFAAANTMYAQIAARRREIGTLRALGFGRLRILLSFLAEAVFLGLLGGIVGSLLAIPLDGMAAGTTNFLTFSEITFELTLSMQVVGLGILLAILTGLIGGLPPALSAARQPITSLLRST